MLLEVPQVVRLVALRVVPQVARRAALQVVRQAVQPRVLPAAQRKAEVRAAAADVAAVRRLRLAQPTRRC